MFDSSEKAICPIFQINNKYGEQSLLCDCLGASSLLHCLAGGRIVQWPLDPSPGKKSHLKNFKFVEYSKATLLWSHFTVPPFIFSHLKPVFLW